MKKKTIIAVFAAILAATALTGCSRMQKGFNDFATYRDPQIIGGTWTVKQDGWFYEGLECIYWGSEGDETACFRDKDGREYFFSGTYTLISEKDMDRESSSGSRPSYP